ncbi:MAG: alcohol dehydrogenase catalytic domain-containing protein [Gemmatimonadetes bacterium]|nr:alcohol dehydrogenase catalytic domain-containing protein [Gemmatimonadota bacterium]
MPDRMRVWRLTAPGELRLEEVETPRPRDGELLVRVEVALTCGTDVKLWLRGHPKIPFPTILGHEYAGRVAAVGRGVRGFSEGDRVVALPTAPCGDCAYCLRRLENLCVHLFQATGFGGYSDYVLLPRHIVNRHAFPIPSGVSEEVAAFVEPLACVWHGASRIDLAGDRTVAFLGDGPIALLFVQLARLLGAGRTVLIGRHPRRLETARIVGADCVVDATHEPMEARVRELTDGLGADTVVECVGMPEAWHQAIALARRGGQILLFGGCEPGTEVCLDTARLHYDELDLRGGFHYTPSSARRAYEWICDGALRLGPLISERVPLIELPRALERVRRREVVKVAVRP